MKAYDPNTLSPKVFYRLLPGLKGPTQQTTVQVLLADHQQKQGCHVFDGDDKSKNTSGSSAIQFYEFWDCALITELDGEARPISHLSAHGAARYKRTCVDRTDKSLAGSNTTVLNPWLDNLKLPLLYF